VPDKSMPNNYRLINAHLAITTGVGATPGIIENGYVEIDRGVISAVGEMSQLEGDTAANTNKRVDCQGRLVTPGLIDCHTHLIYGGGRQHEFEQRLSGVSYETIARQGGGINSTVRATQETSEEALTQMALARLDCLLREGVTTVEIKSGYGLETKTELKMLRAARKLTDLRPVDVKTSFLGAHALPHQYAGRSDEYIAHVCDHMLPAVAAEGLADAVDGFCEGIAFSCDQIERVFKAAVKHGLPVKLHAEQLSNLGGAALAARYGAMSVDHIEYLDPKGVDAIAAAGTVAVVLPGAFYYLNESQKPPVQALRDAGVPIAVATDHNPGSSPILSLLATMNMACVLFGLTPHEALLGVTANAAKALRLDDRGMITVGNKADLVVWQANAVVDLVYSLGKNPCHTIIKDGRIVLAKAEE
jgi:imidazolonepropionase